MSRKGETQISEFDVTVSEEPKLNDSDPIEIVFCLERWPDGTFHIGNSHECPRSEAKEMIKAGLAKHASKVIGEIPDGW